MTENEVINHHVSKLTKSQINQRDIFGRTLLHLAASVGDFQLVEQILDHAHSDPSLADYESGYTALHRAFYSGNISCAQILLQTVNDRSQLFHLVDRDKLSPLDLLSEHFDFGNYWNPKKIGGSDLFTFGSNANHTLGFADSDNRTNPQMVRKLKRAKDIEGKPPRTQFKPTRVIDFKVSKLHSAIITDESVSNLLICGIPTEGRLGLSSHNGPLSTQFSFINIPAFDDQKIVSVALGIDHSVAITRSGDCFTWGSNKYGQLGYHVDSSQHQYHQTMDGKYTPRQFTPRKVSGDLKKASRLSGCTASRIHTVVYNESEMYCWGKNAGQLGFSSSNNNSDEIINQPRLVLHIPSNIEMVCATEIATVLLLDTHDVWVFMNGERFKVPFHQVETFSINSDSFDVFRPRRANVPCYVVKIAARGSYVCALFNHGAVYGFNLEKFYNDPVKPSQIVKSLKIAAMWVGKTALKCAVDVDIGEDGSTIICTKAGYVYRKFKQKGSKNRFERVPLINRIQQVRCDQIFGSFAAIRQDILTDPYSIPVSTTNKDMHYLVPFVNYSTSTKIEELLRSHSTETIPVRYIDRFNKRRTKSNNNNDDVDSDDDSDDSINAEEYDSKEHQIEKQGEIFVKSDINQQLIRLLRSFTADALAMAKMSYENDPRCYDMYISNGEIDIPVHRAIIKNRCLRFSELIEDASPSSSSINVPDVGTITYESNKKRLKFEGFQLETLAILVYYFYTDHIIAVWDTFPAYGEPPAIVKTKSQLLQLGKTLKLEYMRAGILRKLQPSPTLNSDLLRIRGDFADVTIKLKDEISLLAHSYILRARSSYFAVLLSGRWQLNKDGKGRTEIDQSESTLEVFKIVLAFIYGDKQMDIFDDTVMHSEKEFMNFVLSVLITSDELSLMRLKEICQSILSDFVTVTNCGWMLEKSVIYHAYGLRDRVLHYICQNIDCIMENGFLNDVYNDELLVYIDDRLKLYQGQFARTHGGVYSQIREYVNDINEVNDFMTRVVPLYGSRDQRKLSISEIPQTRRASSNGKLPSVNEDMLGKGQNSNAPPTTTSQRRRSSRRSSSGNNANILKENIAQIKAQSANTGNEEVIEKSPNSVKKAQSPNIASSWSDTNSNNNNISPISIGEVYKNNTNNNFNNQSANNNNSGTKMPTVSTPTKLSQKERKKQQRETNNNYQLDSSDSKLSGSFSSPWKTNNKSASPWKIPNGANTSGNQSSSPESSPFSMYKDKGKAPSKSPGDDSKAPAPALGDIIRQEQKKMEAKTQQSSRSLKEIQQEEEFDKWWAMESERIQQLEKSKSSSVDNSGSTESAQSRGRGGKGRRGGRGRGRGDYNNNNNYRGRGKREQPQTS